MVWTDTKAAGDDILSADWNDMVAFLGGGTAAAAASYIIYLSGGLYYIFDGAAGTHDSGNASFSTQKQACIDALTAGGLIYLPAGTYVVDAPIILDDYISITGEGKGTILSLASSVDDDMFKDDGADLNSIHISNMWLDGNSAGNAAGDCFDVGTKYSLFEGLRIDDFKGDGIDHENLAAASATHFQNLRISDCQGYGMTVKTANDCFIDNVNVYRCGNGTLPAIYLGSGSGGMLMSNFHLGCAGTSRYGLEIEDASKITASDFIIENPDREAIYAHTTTGELYIDIHDGKVHNAGTETDDTYAAVKFDAGVATPYKWCNVHDLLFWTDVVASNPGGNRPNYCFDVTRFNYSRIHDCIFAQPALPAPACYGTGIISETACVKLRYDSQSQSPESVDLSGAATDKVFMHFRSKVWLTKAILLYTEASSGDAGVTVRIGMYDSDGVFAWVNDFNDDYFYTGTSEINKAQWYSTEVTLLQNLVDEDDVVTIGTAGGKAGAGEIAVIIEYLTGGTTP